MPIQATKLTLAISSAQYMHEGNMPSRATADPVKAQYSCDDVWAMCQLGNDLQANNKVHSSDQ